MENKKLTKLELLPVEAIMHGNKTEEGLPRISRNLDWFEHFADICQPFGVKLTLDKNNIIQCSW